MTAIKVLHAIQLFGFIASQFTNFLLLILIYTKAEKLFGSYRYVMYMFSGYGLIYSWIEIVTQPIMHMKGPLFIVLMDSPFANVKWFANNMTCLYCASFALCISLLAIQFLYRYIVVCRPEYTQYINGKNVAVLLVPCAFAFALCFTFVYFGMANTVAKQDYLRDDILLYYNVDIRLVGFIAPMYWEIGPNGEKIWNYGEVMFSVGCVCLIFICFLTILICAFKTYRKMQETKEIMSPKTRDLNKQLFITLTFQTIVPFFMMHAPVELLFFLPMCGIDVGRLANVTSGLLGVYPFVEPLVALFLIKEFRQSIMCRNIKNKNSITSSVKKPSNATRN